MLNTSFFLFKCRQQRIRLSENVCIETEWSRHIRISEQRSKRAIYNGKHKRAPKKDRHKKNEQTEKKNERISKYQIFIYLFNVQFLFKAFKRQNKKKCFVRNPNMSVTSILPKHCVLLLYIQTRLVRKFIDYVDSSTRRQREITPQTWCWLIANKFLPGIKWKRYHLHRLGSVIRQAKSRY